MRERELLQYGWSHAILFVMVLSGCGNPNPVVQNSVGVNPAQNTTERKDPVPSIQVMASPTPESSPTPVPSSLVPTQSILAAQGGSLTCDASGVCQPALALVSIPTADGLTRCTGFLIAPDEVLTNDHCLKDFNETSCEDKIYIHFVGETISCESIVMSSKQTGLQTADYTILKLKTATKRTPLKLSARGFKDREAATLYRVQMQDEPNHYDGVQSKLDCQAAYGTFLYPHLNLASDSLMSFSGCPVVEGNSGSPILNANGEVGAVEQGFLSMPQDSTLLSDLKKAELDPSFGMVTLGTQMICISGACGPAPDTALESVANYLATEGEYRAPVFSDADALLDWDEVIPPQQDRKIFLNPPHCIAKGAQAGVSVQVKEEIYQKGINASWLPEWRLENPIQISMNVLETITPTMTEGILQMTEGGAISLPVCTP